MGAEHDLRIFSYGGYLVLGIGGGEAVMVLELRILEWLHSGSGRYHGRVE